MSSSAEFNDFVLENLNNIKGFYFKSKKMFGEYCIYISNDNADFKPIFLLCDNQLFVNKKYKILQEILESKCEVGLPYPNAKEHYILDIENLELLDIVVNCVFPLLNKKSKTKKD